MPFPLDALVAPVIGGLLVNVLTPVILHIGRRLLRWALVGCSVLSERLSVSLRCAADRIGPSPC